MLLLTGCNGTQENPIHFTLDCIDNQLIIFYTKDGVKKQIELTANGVVPMQANSTFVLGCNKNGSEIIVNDTAVIPFNFSPKLGKEQK